MTLTDTCAAPGRICKPCEANQPCAFVLQLSVADERRLARVLALVGDNPQWNAHRHRSVATEQRTQPDDEPRTYLTCPKCGRVETMFTYLLEFLQRNHVRLPECPVCAATRRAA